MGLTCDEPIKVGLITDGTGALAIYGAHIIRSFMLGMEYATGEQAALGMFSQLKMAPIPSCWMDKRSRLFLAMTSQIQN